MSDLNLAYTKLSLLFPKLREDDQIRLQEVMDDLTRAMVVEKELEDQLRSMFSGHDLPTLVRAATAHIKDLGAAYEILREGIQLATVEASVNRMCCERCKEVRDACE